MTTKGENKMHHLLGSTVKDTITGFEGRAVGFTEYITGCNQILVQPPLDKDGKWVESHWIDESRLKADTGIQIRIESDEHPGFDKPAPKR